MDRRTIEGVKQSLDEMRAARDELAKGQGYVGTAEAVDLCPFKAGEDTLLGYPDFVLPRFPKNPRAKRLTYLWDPRDIKSLPNVLRRWYRAVARGPEAEREFAAQRARELEERDLATLGLKEAA